MVRVLRIAVVVAFVVLAVGCGGSEPTGPKEALSDKEKQQVKDLNQQRQDEWGGTNKKK